MTTKWSLRKLSAAACVLFSALALTAWYASSTHASTRANVNIGELNDFTGTNSGLAPYATASALAAEYAINAGGGILGGQAVNVPVDTKSDPADGLVSVERALATNSIQIASGPGTEVAAAIVPVLSQRHIMIDCYCGNPQYDATTDPYFWRPLAPDPVGGETMALFAKQHGYKRVAAVFGTDASSQGDLPGVQLGVKATHLRLVASIGLTPDQTSYRSQVEKLIAARPQAILTESDGPTAAAFYGELKQLGKLVPILGTNATLTSTYLKPLATAIGATALTKDYWAEASARVVTTPAAAAYNVAIEHVANHLPSPKAQWLNNSWSEANYDMIIAFALAMVESKSTNPAIADKAVTRVTEPGAGKTVVYTYKAGVSALNAGKRIQYIGASGPLKFDKYHNSFGDQSMARATRGGAVTSSVTIPASQIEALAKSE
jgi:branched-chain amino acid transport system substrate-binding protein